jgi:hypothetical protein
MVAFYPYRALLCGLNSASAYDYARADLLVADRKLNRRAYRPACCGASIQPGRSRRSRPVFSAPVAVKGGLGKSLFVADGGQNAVFRLAPDGSSKRRIARASGPFNLAVDNRGNVYGRSWPELAESCASLHPVASAWSCAEEGPARSGPPCAFQG